MHFMGRRFFSHNPIGGTLILSRCRKANLPAVPEYRPFDQIDLADGVQISRRASEFSCSASKM